MHLKKNIIRILSSFIFLSLVQISYPNLLISQGISREEDSKLSPAPPGNLIIKRINSEIKIKWTGTGSDTVKFYNIYRNCHGTWEKFRQIEPKAKNTGTYEILFYSENDCLFSISITDNYGNEGPESDALKIK
jgi:hypothetical protein